jgi:membrane protease YdiL (CAAX protease family)
MDTSTHFYLSLVAVALAIDHLVLWRRFTGRSIAEPERARLVLCQSWLAMLWLLALSAVAVWAYSGRPWSLLRLQLPAGWSLVGSSLLVLGVVALYSPTISKLRRASAEQKIGLRARLGSHAAMLPHTTGELAWFTALSATAGVCEELIFRGYILWAAQSVLGLWPAVVLSCLAFALAHAYQGIDGIIKTGLVGAFFMASVLFLGSLLPAMVAHALIDIGQGVVAWLILREDGPQDVQARANEKAAADVGAQA